MIVNDTSMIKLKTTPWYFRVLLSIFLIPLIGIIVCLLMKVVPFMLITLILAAGYYVLIPFVLEELFTGYKIKKGFLCKGLKTLIVLFTLISFHVISFFFEVSLVHYFISMFNKLENGTIFGNHFPPKTGISNLTALLYTGRVGMLLIIHTFIPYIIFSDFFDCDEKISYTMLPIKFNLIEEPDTFLNSIKANDLSAFRVLGFHQVGNNFSTIFISENIDSGKYYLSANNFKNNSSTTIFHNVEIEKEIANKIIRTMSNLEKIKKTQNKA